MGSSHERNKMISTKRQGDFYLISKVHIIPSEVYTISHENGYNISCETFAVNIS